VKKQSADDESKDEPQKPDIVIFKPDANEKLAPAKPQ
ncbi:MAG: hypothetical protein JWO94_737, partial [Verrucomicrobiaceae bacterium]|nr:hypothetical protein [Verrucomicrobiaceae bacterium]